MYYWHLLHKNKKVQSMLSCAGLAHCRKRSQMIKNSKVEKPGPGQTIHFSSFSLFFHIGLSSLGTYLCSYLSCFGVSDSFAWLSLCAKVPQPAWGLAFLTSRTCTSLPYLKMHQVKARVVKMPWLSPPINLLQRNHMAQSLWVRNWRLRYCRNNINLT